jgi:hypothetical protein
MLPSAFDGGIDEVALYEVALPDAIIMQHHQDAILHHLPYSFPSEHIVLDVAANASKIATRAVLLPTPDPKPTFDLKDFPPGTLLPTPPSTYCGTAPAGDCPPQPTQGVKLSPLAQLQSFPLPR